MEKELPEIRVKVIDYQEENLDWERLKGKTKQKKPDIVGSGSYVTYNVYKTSHTLNLAKHIDPEVVTIVEGSHFTMMDEETLEEYPIIDIIIRYEAKNALVDYLKYFQNNGNKRQGLQNIRGISFKENGVFTRTIDYPPLIGKELDNLPYPTYHLLPDIALYHFKMMSNAPNILLEGSHCCTYNCTFCSHTIFYRYH